MPRQAISAGESWASAGAIRLVTPMAIEGQSRHPEGWLALIILHEQFSRSLWRDTARAFAQDTAALSLVKGGLLNAHYAALLAGNAADVD